MTDPSHVAHMRVALEQAAIGASEGNPAVGSVVVRDGEIVARGRNLVGTTHDPTAHAETVALREAGPTLGTDNMEGCTLYTTFEPCAMCCGALMNAGVSTLVMGGRPAAGESRWGGYTVERLIELAGRGDHVEVVTGVLVDECLRVRGT